MLFEGGSVAAEWDAQRFLGLSDAERESCGLRSSEPPKLADLMQRLSRPASAFPAVEARGIYAGYERGMPVLEGITVAFDPGRVVGVVGRNGVGKSTLLKTIAGVYKPSKGKVTVNGTIAPLIELGAGFDMDLTARENIYLNGTVLGFSPKYLDEKFDEIVEFSELQNFLDVPLKNYSSGMVARIGFAIATITKPDILIADEVLSVGDFLFQQKCEKRMKELMAGGTTVILVSHSIEQIERMCSKVAWLSHGHLKMNGDTQTVCAAYKATQRGEV